MLVVTDLYAAFLLLTVLPTGYLICRLWDHREQPGGRWFVLALSGSTGWGVCWGLMLLFNGYTLSLLSMNLVIVFVTVTFVGMLFMSIEYTWRTHIGYRIIAPVLVVPLAVQLLLWTNPLHGLFWGPETVVNARGVLQLDHGIGFFLHTGYGYLLVVTSLVLLVVSLVDRKGLYRKQAALMLVGWLVPAATSVVFVFGMFPTNFLNPTPVGFLVGVSIWGWALFRYRLLRAMPIARRTALREMDEGVLILDEETVITDTNPAAQVMLDTDGDPAGRRLERVLDPFPSLQSALHGGPVTDQTVAVSSAGDKRFLTVSKTPIEQGEAAIGWVVALKDQTELMRHEEDLELLREVLGRVLRHDIRNKLNVVRMNGELLAHRTDDNLQKKARRVVDSADDIIETAETARAIESLVDADRDRYDIDLVAVVSDTVDWATEKYPMAVLEVDTPTEAWVRADEAVTLAVRSLIENAIDHNESPAPSVRVAIQTEAETIRLVVEDHGPGITQQERQVFYSRSIDQLNHGSGLGLWLVDWVVRNSEASLDIDADDSGTRVSVTFTRSFETADADREADRERS